MTIKHQPATPLPWIKEQQDRRLAIKGTEHLCGIFKEVRPLTIEQIAENIYDEDAAYIAHAANAYPKLVEHIKDAPILEWHPSAFVGFSEEQLALIKRGFDHALNRVHECDQRLLRELGEAS